MELSPWRRMMWAQTPSLTDSLHLKSKAQLLRFWSLAVRTRNVLGEDPGNVWKGWCWEAQMLPAWGCSRGPLAPAGQPYRAAHSVTIYLSPSCSSVKLRDFQSAVNNFEKALERAKLIHNSRAQQAIINVSLFPAGPALGLGGPPTPHPGLSAPPPNRRAHSG